MDDDEDYGSDIDDAEFLAIATQVEQEYTSSANRTATHSSTGRDGDDNDEIEAPVAVQTPRGGGGLRQMTLFGGAAEAGRQVRQVQQGQVLRRNFPLASAAAQEKPTHHRIDLEAAKTWVYPINVSFRDYQFNIVRRALLSNVLCALPTGGSLHQGGGRRREDTAEEEAQDWERPSSLPP